MGRDRSTLSSSELPGAAGAAVGARIVASPVPKLSGITMTTTIARLMAMPVAGDISTDRTRLRRVIRSRNRGHASGRGSWRAIASPRRRSAVIVRAVASSSETHRPHRSRCENAASAESLRSPRSTKSIRAAR